MTQTTPPGRLGSTLLAVVTVAGCGLSACSDSPAVKPTVPAASDRPTPGGEVTRTCGSHFAENFDRGLEDRTVTAGPVSLVAFRVSPIPSGQSPARNFKVMVRLTPGAEAVLRTTTSDTALSYDRAKFNKDNVYRLADGDRSVTFIGCPDRSAVFNGAILTTGLRTVDLEILANGDRTPATVTAHD